jgi:ribosomal protein S18 acetylase RimI-like enzyme
LINLKEIIKIRNLKKSDFEKYKNLREKGLKDYQILSKEKLKLSSKQIKEEFNKILLNKKRICFVIEEEKEIRAYITGTVMKTPSKIITYIDDIFVEKNSRKKGFGKRLMNEFLKWSKSKKAKSIRLGVRTNNKKAIQLYKKIGFQTHYYEMEKNI